MTEKFLIKKDFDQQKILVYKILSKAIFYQETFLDQKYQPSGAMPGVTRSPPATPHSLQCRTACNTEQPATSHSLQCRTAYNATQPAKSKMATRGPQNGRRGLERCLPLGFWAF